MVFPSEKSRLLKPCTTSIDGSEAALPRQKRPASSPPDLEALRSRVSFVGWRFAHMNFKSWTEIMADLHEATWRKAGIFEAIKASTYRIHKNEDLVLGISEKWCPDTKTFVFPWGETTITLEDVMALLGFSVLGLPVFATLDSSEKKIQRTLEKEWVKIRKDQASFVTQTVWMKRFVDTGGELEHAAFLALWLSYFVLSSRYHHIPKNVLRIAVHLSSGTRIALAPAVLAHLYSELSLLKTHIRNFTMSPLRIELGSLFQLVQLWAWERFKELQPKPRPIHKGEPRMARWYDIKQTTSDVRQILDNSKVDSFEWRPYTIAVRNWKFPKFYPEKAMQIPVGPDLDDEFISYARCIKVSELVGIDCVEYYFPNRVASQFGIVQNVPPSPVKRNNLSEEEAWEDYDKPVDDLTLNIPSRSETPCFTPTFSKWWNKSFAEFQYSSSKDTTSFVPSGYKMYKRRKRSYEDSESSLGQVQSNNDSHTLGVMMRLSEQKYKKKVRICGGAALEPLGKISRLSADNNDSGRHVQKLALINKMRNHLKLVREKKKRKDMEQARDKRDKHMKQDNNDDEEEDDSLYIVDRIEEEDNNEPSPRDNLALINKMRNHLKFVREKKKRKDMEQVRDKRDKHMKQDNNDDEEEDDSLYIVDRIEEEDNNEPSPRDNLALINKMRNHLKFVRDKKKRKDMKQARDKRHKDMNQVPTDNNDEEDDSLNIVDGIEEADKNEPSPCENLAFDGCETSKARESFGLSASASDGNHGQGFLLYDNGVGSEETMKSKEQLEDSEKKNDEFGVDEDSYGKSLQELKQQAMSLEERIKKAQEKVALLKEKRAAKQRKIA